jgi:hypothetical protein
MDSFCTLDGDMENSDSDDEDIRGTIGPGAGLYSDISRNISKREL